MKYSELVRNEVSAPEIQEFLAEGEATAVTIRIPKNLKDAAMEAANLRGVSFSAFVRMCMIDELTSGRKRTTDAW